jgi:predicted ester cyclase
MSQAPNAHRATAADFDYSAQLTIVSETAARNWERLREHTVAEWSGDLDATMATMTRNAPFQIFHPSGLSIVGYDEVRAFYAERFQTFSGQGFFAKRWVVTDDVAVGQGWYQGAPSGPFFGFETHGKPLFFAMALWVYFEGGLLKGEALYANGAEMAAQIRDGATGDVRAELY